MSRLNLILIALIFFLSVKSQENAFNCYTLIAGKGATADGAVIVAHNEDDFGEQIVNFYKVPARPAGTEFATNTGETIVSEEESVPYLWLEMPGMNFSDCFLNESGVVVVSNQCSSKEENPELSYGGIQYQLRKQIAGQARSARHGVKLAIAMLEKFGYNSSGRTYTIADPDEAYILAVVNGKHYAAVRVPDNKVAVIPNYYTLTDIDMNDTVNFLVSPDLITYAEEQGWYNSADGDFNFRLAYASEGSLKHPVNIGRMWRGVNILSGKEYQYDDSFPTFFDPGKPVEVKTFMNLLRDHYEGTELSYIHQKIDTPHHEEGTICATHTQYGLVAQLRPEMPVEIGAVLWIAMRRPCTQSFIPWYAGISEIPNGFAKYDYQWAEKNHKSPEEGTWDRVPVHSYFFYKDYADFVDENYSFRQKEALKKAQKTENKYLEKQQKFEKQLLKLKEKNPQRYQEKLNEITARATAKTIKNSLTK
jgi:dipeptidase